MGGGGGDREKRGERGNRQLYRVGVRGGGDREQMREGERVEEEE